MKIVIEDVGVWLPRTKTWLYNELIALDSSWSAHVIANRTENESEFPFTNVYSLRAQRGKLRWYIEMLMRRSGLFAHAPSIMRHCSALNADVLHSHFGTVGWFNLKFAKALKVPHVVTFYGFDVTRIPRAARWRERYLSLFDQVAAVLCEGPHMANEIIKLGCPEHKVKVHRLGVDLEKLPFRARQCGGHTKFLMIGSFREKKGLTYGLEALGKWSATTGSENWQLTIVGGPGNHPEGNRIDAELRSIAERFSISKKITYTGFLSHEEMIRAADDHDVFISPSVTASDGDTEGGAPVTMIEMAAMGLLVVGTVHCDLPSTVAEDNRALLVKERSVAELEDSLTLLLSGKLDWASLGRHNRAHCEQYFDHKRQGVALAKLYDEALEAES